MIELLGLIIVFGTALIIAGAIAESIAWYQRWAFRRRMKRARAAARRMMIQK